MAHIMSKEDDYGIFFDPGSGEFESYCRARRDLLTKETRAFHAFMHSCIHAFMHSFALLTRVVDSYS